MATARTGAPQPGASGPSDVLLFGLLLGAPVAGGLVLAAGLVSGRLWGGAWPDRGEVGLAELVIGLVREPGEPALAWPAPARELIPGPVAFYSVLATMGIVAVALALVGWTLVRRMLGPAAGRRSKHSPVEPVASWAHPRQLGPLLVKGPEPGRLVLGRAGRRLLATEARQSACILGPTQTGKTTGFAVPAMLEWRGPILATSVKDDLVAHTVGWRAGVGRVWVYDPSAATGRRCAHWSPLAAATTWSGAQRVASGLCQAAKSRGGLDDADFWYLTAEKLLAPYLFAAARRGRDMAAVVRWVDQQEVDEVATILSEAGEQAALGAAWASWRREERTRSSVFTTAELVVKAFADPVVAASAARSEITPEGLLDGKANTLYLCAPTHEQQRLRPLFAALVHQIITAVYERAAASRGPLDPPLLVVLDEAANIAPLRDLDALASTAAGVGIQLVTIWQDFAQLTARYGERGHTVANNHRAKVVLSGISDPSTLDYVSRLVGDEEVSQASVTTDSQGLRSSTESVTYRRLAPVGALRRLRPGEGILVYGHLLPTHVRLRPWYADRELERRASLAEAVSADGGTRADAAEHQSLGPGRVEHLK